MFRRKVSWNELLGVVKLTKVAKTLLFLAVILLSSVVVFVLYDGDKTPEAPASMYRDRLLLVVSRVDFGAKYKSTRSNSWQYLVLGMGLESGSELLADESFSIRLADGREISFVKGFHGMIVSMTKKEVDFEIYQGSFFAKPWSSSSQRLSVKVKKEVFNVRDKNDYLDITVKDNEVLRYSYKTNGVVITK